MLNIIEEDLGTNQTLVEILFGVVSPMLISHYVELNTTLVTAGVTVQLEALDLLEPMIHAQEIDSLTIPDEVDDIMREASRIALQVCGVGFDEEISISQLSDLCRIILHFDVSESPQTLIDKIESADDDIDAILITLSYLTDQPYEEWLPVITSVGVGLVDRIKHLAHTANDLVIHRTDADLKSIHEYQQRLDRLKQVQDSELVEDLDGLHSEPSFESLYVIHLPAITQASQQDAVESIMAICCVSHTNSVDMLKGVDVLLDDLYETPTSRMSAEQIKESLLPKYQTVYG